MRHENIAGESWFGLFVGLSSTISTSLLHRDGCNMHDPGFGQHDLDLTTLSD